MLRSAVSTPSRYFAPPVRAWTSAFARTQTFTGFSWSARFGVPHDASAALLTFDHAEPDVGRARISWRLSQIPGPLLVAGHNAGAGLLAGALTVTSAEPVMAMAAAAIATGPAAMPVTSPDDVTVAIAGFALANVTATPVMALPAWSFTVAVNGRGHPAVTVAVADVTTTVVATGVDGAT